MSRKIGEFNVTEFVNAYLVNDDIDNISRLIANVKLNSDSVLTTILKCYKEQYFDRFFDLMRKVMIGISILEVYETNNIIQYECDKFSIDLESIGYVDLEILSIVYEDETLLRITGLSGCISYLHINAKQMCKSLTETELLSLIR